MDSWALPDKTKVSPELVVERRNQGAAWLEIQREFSLTRQQARYAYQLGKRAERRAGRVRST
ncbi:MAG: hypothetical protein ACR2JC_01920 [Chloroflexota bacterium]